MADEGKVTQASDFARRGEPLQASGTATAMRLEEQHGNRWAQEVSYATCVKFLTGCETKKAPELGKFRDETDCAATRAFTELFTPNLVTVLREGCDASKLRANAVAMALVHIVEGADGYITDWQGQPVGPDFDGPHHSGGPALNCTRGA